MNFNRRIAGIVTLFTIINLAYLFYGIIVSKSFIDMVVCIFLVLFETAAGFVFYTAVRKQMNHVEKLSQNRGKEVYFQYFYC